MIRRLIIVSCLLITGGVCAQTPPVSATRLPAGQMPPYCQCPDFVLDSTRVFYPAAIGNSKNRVEIRLYQPSKSNVKLTILTYKDKLWKAAYYLKKQPSHVNFQTDYANGIFKYQFHGFEIKNQQLDSVFLELVMADIFKTSTISQSSKKGTMRLEYIVNGQSGSYFLDSSMFSGQEKMDEKDFRLMNIFDSLTKGQGPIVLNEE